MIDADSPARGAGPKAERHFAIDVPVGLALGWATRELFVITIEPEPPARVTVVTDITLPSR